MEFWHDPFFIFLPISHLPSSSFSGTRHRYQVYWNLKTWNHNSQIKPHHPRFTTTTRRLQPNSQHLSHCYSKGSTWDSHLSYIGSIGGKASVSNLYPHQPGQSGTDEPFAALTHYYSCCRCFFCSSSGCCVKDREQAASVASRRRQAAVRWRGGR